MEDKIKFPANVILIDVAFLNEVVYGAKNFLEGKLGRKLPDVDLPAWLSYLALDAGLREQENEVEVLLVHTPAADVLKQRFLRDEVHNFAPFFFTLVFEETRQLLLHSITIYLMERQQHQTLHIRRIKRQVHQVKKQLFGRD